LFSLLFSMGVLLALLQPRARAWRGPMLIVLGALVGLAALTRGQGLLLLPIAVLTWRLGGLRWREALTSGAVAGAVTCIVIAPWIFRNERELGSPVIIATNFGPNVWYGNHEGATGRSVPVAPPQPERGDLTQPEYEVAASNLALREGLEYVVSHPIEEVRLAGTKVRAMYESDAAGLDWNSAYGSAPAFSFEKDRFLRKLANGYWFAALILAGAGLVASRRAMRSEAAVIPLIVGVWTLGHLAFFGDSRFHYPVVFAIALLSAQGALALHAAVWRAESSPRRGYVRA
jgi:4-amino-4-deoxy-L-arabinose transferase-like glycosyltransferase